MALTPAQRQQNQRDRKRGLPDTYPPEPKPLKADIEAKIDQYALDYHFAKEIDDTGKFYKSECRPTLDLLAIYEGTNILDKESDDEEDDIGDGEGKKKVKKAKKKENRPNPSRDTLSIRAVTKPIEMIKDSGIYTVANIEPNSLFTDRQIKEFEGVVSFQRWLDFRDKARNDLFWLCRLLGLGVFHSVHQYVCDQFVQKRFSGLYFPDYNLDDFHDMVREQKRYTLDGVTECRETVLLESRGSYKSTINRADCVSWLINCPDIRIMFITATRSLAKKSAKLIKKYFYLKQKAVPTAFQILFPEYILTGKDGASETPLECPARIHIQTEASLWVTSMESTSTGDHCDVRKADDIVVPKNSANKELREQLKFEFDGTDDILDQWGFSDVIGTRYFTDDWYGTRALPNEETKEVAPYKYSCRGCWTLNPEDAALYAMDKLSIAQILREQRATLTFPYKLSWSSLRNTYNKKGERSFKNQQLNEATDPTADENFINPFTLDGLRAHSYARTAAPLPQDMRIIQIWDIAYGKNKKSDWAFGVTIGIYLTQEKQEAVVVLDAAFGKWGTDELDRHIVEFYQRSQYAPSRIYIEDALGVGFLMKNIKNICLLHGLDMFSKIALLKIDLADHAKRNRIKNLAFLLGQDRLHFVNGNWHDEVFKQFIEYKGGKSTAYRKDDGPDVISLVIELLSPTALMARPDPKLIEAEHEKRQAKVVRDGLRDRMFGGSYMPQAIKASEWMAQQKGIKRPPPPAPEPAPSSPRTEALKKMGRILPPGMRL